MRREERREGDHDQVVEEEDPPGHEPGEVVERDANEGRRAAGLADRRGSLCVRERDDHEEDPDEAEHHRREAERVRGDDPEREVDRGGDLAVRDGGEGGRVEDALELWQLPGHPARIIAAAGGRYAPCRGR